MEELNFDDFRKIRQQAMRRRAGSHSALLEQATSGPSVAPVDQSGLESLPSTLTSTEPVPRQLPQGVSPRELGNSQLPTRQELSQGLEDVQPSVEFGAALVGGTIGGTAGALSPIPGGSAIGSALLATGLRGSVESGIDIIQDYLKEKPDKMSLEEIQQKTSNLPPESQILALVKASRDAALEVGVDMVFGPLGSAVGAVAGRSMHGLKRSYQGIKRLFRPEDYEQIIDIKPIAQRMLDSGIPLTPSVVGNKMGGLAQDVLSGLPLSSGPVLKSVNASLKAIDNNIDNTIGKSGQVFESTEELGNRIKSIIKGNSGIKLDDAAEAIVNKSNISKSKSYVFKQQKKINALYEIAGDVLPDETPVLAKDTHNMLKSELEDLGNNRQVFDTFVGQKIKLLFDELNSKTILSQTGEGISSPVMPWKTLKKFRTEIGNIAFDARLNDDTPKLKAQKLYNMMTDDLEGAARNVSDEAADAWSTARDAVAEFKSSKKLIANIADSDFGERSFDLATKTGNKSLRTLKNVIKDVDPDAWNDFRATYIYKLAKEGATDTKYNMAKFAKNIKTKVIDKEKLDILFDEPGLKKEYSDMVKLFDDINHQGLLKNSSKTSVASSLVRLFEGAPLVSAAGAIGSGAGAGAGVVAGAVPLLTPLAFGKILTHQPTLKWLISTIRSNPQTAEEIGATFGRLNAIAAADPLIAAPIKEMLYTGALAEDFK